MKKIVLFDKEYHRLIWLKPFEIPSGIPPKSHMKFQIFPPFFQNTQLFKRSFKLLWVFFRGRFYAWNSTRRIYWMEIALFKICIFLFSFNFAFRNYKFYLFSITNYQNPANSNNYFFSRANNNGHRISIKSEYKEMKLICYFPIVISS